MTHTIRPETAPAAPADTTPHLWTRLRLVEERVRRAVELRRAVDPDPDDPYRGQYLTPEAAARVLDGPHGPGLPALAPDAPPPGSPLDVLATRFALEPLDVDLLLVALAPDLDARFERLYGYLNDDLTRRRPTVGLALELCGRTGVGGGGGAGGDGGAATPAARRAGAGDARRRARPTTGHGHGGDRAAAGG
ncbi:hypothetical protein ACFCYI_10465, partial [Streptomyces sp. NPDC056257]